MVKHLLQTESIISHGWSIRTVKGPIMGDAETEQYRSILDGVLVLPEMVYSQNVVELTHLASGTKISFTALDALQGWCLENLPPLQVKVAEEWRRAREVEIQQQQAVQLTYDWTFTTPYNCTVTHGTSASAHYTQLDKTSCTASPASQAHANARAAAAAATGSSSAAAVSAPQPAEPALDHGHTAQPHADTHHPGHETHHHKSHQHGHEHGHTDGATASVAHVDGAWHETTDQIDRALLMERDPILLYDEVVLYESDLDDNGVCQLSVKLRVMPRCWLVLLRLWMRVDGSIVRLRESRLFCRHDRGRADVLLEVKHSEGLFADLRKQGAPDEGPAYADADAATQVFQAIAPIGLKVLKMFKLSLP